MQKFKNQTLKMYLDLLASRNPTPGGGSVAALVAALGAGLISMVANYSIKKTNPASLNKRMQAVLKESEKLRKQFLDLVDLDAEAYLGVVKTRNASPEKKKKALKKASEIPMKVCRLCYAAMQLTPPLVKEGNRYLLSDVKVAVELLVAAFHSAKFNVEANQ